jgi:hypothetical protein
VGQLPLVAAANGPGIDGEGSKTRDRLAAIGRAMTYPENCFFHVELTSFEAREGAFVPILTAAVAVKVNGSGSGSQLRLLHRDASTVYFDLLHVEARLLWVSDERKTTSSLPLIAMGGPRSLRTSNLVLNADYSVELELDFMLSPVLLEELEEARAGGEPRFSIEVRLAGMVRYEFQAKDPASTKQPSIWPFVAEDLNVIQHGTRSHVLVIERSRWIEKLLPSLGFGSWMLYEVPVENFEGAAQVDVYLRNAVQQFLAGEYKLSIAASRDVVETLERELGADANPAFGDKFGSAEEKFRKVTDAFTELTQAMGNYQATLKSLLAAGAHPERPDELVERPDAEMALWVALALRRYVGMRLRTTRAPSSSPQPG